MTIRWNAFIKEISHDLRRLNLILLFVLPAGCAAEWFDMSTGVLVMTCLLLFVSYCLLLGSIRSPDANGEEKPAGRYFAAALGVTVAGLSLPALLG